MLRFSSHLGILKRNSGNKFASINNHQQGILTGYFIKGAPKQLSLYTHQIGNNMSKTHPLHKQPLISKSPSSSSRLHADHMVGYWLLGTSACLFGMMVLGVASRLTRSGLEISNWKPLDSMPPTNQESWQAEFEKFKDLPEFKSGNPDGMSLDTFKHIYMLEWTHRFWGRSLAALFTVPLFIFASQGRIQKFPGMSTNMLGIIALGGFQGIIGWWMVKHDLKGDQIKQMFNQEPKVNPYNVEFHLLSGFAIFSGLLWSGLTALSPNKLVTDATSDEVKSAIRKVKIGGNIILGAAALALVSGVFVASNDAGRQYNDWPFYNGRILPDELWKDRLQPFWRNFFEQKVWVQFEHRHLAYAVAFLTPIVWKRFRRPDIWGNLTKESKLALNLTLASVLTQAFFGIVTLLQAVPLPLGTFHQAGALTVLSTALWLQHSLRYVR